MPEKTKAAKKVTFLDGHREPRCPPNPAFPKGMDIDLSLGSSYACIVDLPYPAPRCGMMAIDCEACGGSAVVTVAGRPDDPRTVKLACKIPAGNLN